jgi:SAM-dependent methyltransferase
MNYNKANNYNDTNKIYENCSGPGGLELAEFMAEKMVIKQGKRLLDVGFYRGYQTCFLAKEYNVNIVGIDPGGSSYGGYGIEWLMKNAREFGVDDKIIGVKSSLPDSRLPTDCFDYAYITNCLHMNRGENDEIYIEHLKEVYRLLKHGGVLGIGEPMCRDIQLSIELEALKNETDYNWVVLDVTVNTIIKAGFTILDSGYCDDAAKWQNEYVSSHDDDDEEKVFIQSDKGQWASVGYVIAVKE